MDFETAGQLVLQTLNRAASQDASTLKPAEQQLRQWETQPGFYSILVAIFTNHSIDINVRWLAVLYFKNGVDRYWRKTAPNAIPEEEKDNLRKQLIGRFDEPFNQVATQLAVVVAKISRLDCPRFWPDLIPTLLEAVKQPEQLYQQRALLTLHHVTKSLASKRLANDRKLFQELTNGIFSFVLRLWNEHTDTFLKQISCQDASMANSAELSLLALRVLRKLLVHGFNQPHDFPDVMTFMNLTFFRLKEMLACRANFPAGNQCKELVDKTIIVLTKVLLDCQHTYPMFFIGFIKQSLEFATTYTFTEASQQISFERFTVNCMNLIKSIIRCDAYRPAKTVEETKNPQTLAAHKIKTEFFTCATLHEICKRLISHYFLLTEEELHMWEVDPEGFCVDEGGESFKFSLRPCVEVLFLTLFHEYRETLTPFLIEIIQSTQGMTDVENMSVLLQKDAVYNVAGLAAYELFDDINFDQWLTSQLLAELQNKHPRFKLIRRRVVWLIGQWVGVKLSTDLRPTVYEALLPLLADTEDTVVRITAAQTLKICVDDFEFKTVQFMPYLESSFELLFQLLQQVSECDTKMQALHVMSFVIERVERQIRPYVSSLIQYLPLLWEESADYNMLRCAILTTLIHLVMGLGSDSVSLYSFLLPVIKFSTDVTQPPHVYLLEDGIDLWLETLHHAPAITSELLQVFANMPALLELGSETSKTCFNIITSYLLLGPKEFLQLYSGTIVNACTSHLGNDVKPEGIVMALRVMENVLKVFPVEGSEMFKQLLPCILQAILKGDDYSMVMSMYLSIYARIILQNERFFFSLLDDVSIQWGKQSSEILGSLIDVVVEKTDIITQTERRKLVAFALGNLLCVNSSVIQEKFCGIIYFLVEVLHDVCRSESGIQSDYLVMSEREELEDEYETEHDKRRRRLSMKDPVHSVSLRDFVINKLSACQQLYGQPVFESMMSTVDVEIVQQMQQFVK
ncbi:importin-11-like [Ptychodera flava]|uniref:importin-11-like n=1 Tax=Ptychodera flava TaxID=63121 RepID=UPI00396A4442